MERQPFSVPSLSEPVSARALAVGALIALAYALLWVSWNGIVVDETVLSAQILNGDVVYPAGHPHVVFHRQAWSLSNQISALEWWLYPDLAFVSATRNVLFLFLTLFAPFALTLVLTRSTIFALCASALVLSDGLARFGGVYPDFALPTFYSHGHVGAFGLLLILALVLGRSDRLGGFLLGLFPAIHPLLGALAWGFGALHLAVSRERPRRRLLTFAAAGAVLAAISFAVALAMAPDPVTTGPFAADAAEIAGSSVRAQFIAYTDVHRQMPSSASATFWFGYLANGALVFALLASLRGSVRSGLAGVNLAGLPLFAGLVWAAVWGTQLFHALLGELPSVVVTAMPNRLSNLSTLLIVPLCVAAFARSKSTGAAISAILLFAAAVINGRGAWLGAWVGDTQQELPGYAMLAGALALGCQSGRRSARLASAAFAILFLALHAWKASSASPWPPATFALVFAVVMFFSRPKMPAIRVPAPLLAVLVGAALLAHLPRVEAAAASRVNAFDRELGAWLATNAGDDEPVLTPLLPRTQVQAKTGQPVLLELGTLWLMPYLPELAPVIGRMTAELYGVDYGDPEAVANLAPAGYLGQWSPIWKRRWEQRKPAEWRDLGERWSFRLVLVPTAWTVDLPSVLAGEEWSLRSIPAK